MTPSQRVVIGIDVGGVRKGFHGVALSGTQLAGVFTSTDPGAMLAWCRSVNAAAVGVDAPSHWRRGRPARAAERELRAAGISCFPSPTRAEALAHPSGWYDWMLNGEALYRSLTRHYALFDGGRGTRGRCFETFPQAIACALAGEHVSAKEKNGVRRRILREAGVGERALQSIDFVDAALCALAAQYFLAGRVLRYGNGRTGYIIVPGRALRARSKS